MPKRAKTVDVEAARKRLAEIVGNLEAARLTVDAILDERRQLFQQLLDAGEKQAVIARWAGVTPMAVDFAVGKSKSKRSTKPKEQKSDEHSHVPVR